MQQGDLTHFPVQVVVNAANEELKLRGGLAAALLRAAGPELQDLGVPGAPFGILDASRENLLRPGTDPAHTRAGPARPSVSLSISKKTKPMR